MPLCFNMLAYLRIYQLLATVYGVSKKFDMNYTLNCKRVDSSLHDVIRDELRDLLAHIFCPFHSRCENMINPSPMYANCTWKRHPCTSWSSDFLNTDRYSRFFEWSTDTIIKFRVTNHDRETYWNLPPKKVLERQEKKKNCKPCES